MKKSLLAILALVFTAQACNLSLTGEETSGSRGVFLSDDSGQTWEAANTISKSRSLTNAIITRLVIEPDRPANILALTFNAGVFASDNGAKNWIQLLPDFTAFDGFINPHNREEIFVAGSRAKLAAILKSADRGATWVQIYGEPAGQAAVTALVFDPNNPAVYLAGLSTGTIIKSGDKGESWNVLTDFDDRIQQFYFGNDGRMVYALTRTKGLKRSPDGGQTWADLDIAQGLSQYFDLAVDPKNPQVLYVGTDMGLYISENGGLNFRKLHLPATPEVSQITAIVVNPTKPNQLFVGVWATVYRSDDQGVAWRTFSLPTRQILNELAVDPQEPNRIYAGFK